MKKMIALVMAMLMALCALPAGASAESCYYIDSTPVYGASSEQLNNIQLASAALDGWYVPSGGYFSFNDAVGPRTKENGYLTAVNGRGSKVRGGGVSQVATTLYLALLQVPGIRFDQITAYGDRFTGDYVSDGALAIVTDYSAGTDFAFTNYGNDLFIYSWTDGRYHYCEIEVTDGTGGYYDDYYDNGNLASSASFYTSGTTGLMNNIQRAAENVSGYVLYSGETFSFNEVVGPRTGEYGFVSAVNGRGVNVVGGGVAQVASVLWLAVKDMPNVTVTEKSTYGNRYNQNYVANSEDAIVTDYNAGTDFAFRYDGYEYLTIYVYLSDGILWCDIYEGDDYGWSYEGEAAPDAGTESQKGSGGLSW